MGEAHGKSVILLSGGMDSVTALHHVLRTGSVAAALSFDYGAKHNRRELEFAALQAQICNVRHIVIPLPFLLDHFQSALLTGGEPIPEGHYEEATMRKTVVPFRNGILLSIAAGVAESLGAKELVIAAHAGDHAIYPDCRPGFLNAMSEAVRLGTYSQIELRRPFVSIDKAAIARRGAELGVDFSKTWSCYVGGPIHCGRCGTCVERREAFLLAGLTDPTDYESLDPLPPKPVNQSHHVDL